MGRRIVETEAQSVMWRVMRAKSFTVEEEQSGTDNSVNSLIVKRPHGEGMATHSRILA